MFMDWLKSRKIKFNTSDVVMQALDLYMVAFKDVFEKMNCQECNSALDSKSDFQFFLEPSEVVCNDCRN